MSTASQGLGKALARAASGAVIALAEMSTDDILAGLSDEQRAGLSAAIVAATPAPAAAAADPEKDPNEKEPDSDPDDMCPSCKQPMKDGKCSKCSPASGAEASADTDRVKAVAAAVATDENCKGKADLALAMLADDDFAGLSASALVKLVARTPVEGASASAPAGDPEAAARAEMKAVISETANSNVDAAGAGANSNAAAASSVWDQAIASNNPGLN